MSRGWESKDVESQQAEFARMDGGPELTPEERIRQASLHGLFLEQTRLQTELKAARHTRHKAMIQAALDHVLGRLKKLEA